MRIGNANGHIAMGPSMMQHQQTRHTTTKNKSGMSAASMQAMISADISMEQAKTQGAVRTEMKGKANVLRSEIEQDGNLGGDTQKKEEALAAMEDKIQIYRRICRRHQKQRLKKNERKKRRKHQKRPKKRQISPYGSEKTLTKKSLILKRKSPLRICCQAAMLMSNSDHGMIPN